MVATVLDTSARLTDDGVTLFDRAIGRMFRRAEAREEEAVLRDARAVNDKVRLLAKLGAALIEAKQSGTDLDGAVAVSVGWDRLAASVAEANKLARPGKTDLPALAIRAWPVLHRLGPLFLGAFQLRAVPAAASTLRAVELLGDTYNSGGKKWPNSLPSSFLRPSWRDAVRHAAGKGGNERRTWEAASLLALRDRLRSGDIWVQGSRQWRTVEDQLITPALFAAMRDAGPLPVAVPATAEEYLTARRALLEQRLSEVAAKAAADKLEDVSIKGDELKISPLKAITPEDAEELADRLYAMMPNARITGVLAEVDRWTGFSAAFTHLHTGLPADDPRVVLTAVLADATNLGLTRMAEACSVASYRQLAWTAGWHLREDTYRQALAILVNAQHSQPIAALFGAPDISSSDGQGFPTSGRGEAVGAINAHYGREASSLFYTHISGRHAPYHTIAIPPSGEATYVIDGLLYHEADMTIATHHTDGGGVSDHVFGLAHLLGFHFAPRIPNLAERRLYAFEPASRWPALAPFIAGRPDDKLIAAHWDDVLRLDRVRANRRRQRVADAQAARQLPPAEWAGAGTTRDRSYRAHPLHPGLVGTATAQATSNSGTQQGRIPECPRACCLLPSPRPTARPDRRSAAAPRERAHLGHSRHSAVEHRLSQSRARRRAPQWRDGARRLAGPSCTTRLAAHQPHRRLPLGCRQHTRLRRIQAAASRVRRAA